MENISNVIELTLPPYYGPAPFAIYGFFLLQKLKDGGGGGVLVDHMRSQLASPVV